MSEPLVSICCITYNHVAFIQQALSGFLMQQASFEYEIIIHDDCSTDGTTEILRVYEAEYPERMRVMYEEENQYSKGRKVFPLTLALARGKYIALCEGDDYWTDPHKLQKQVEYLEAHPECSMCFHNVWVKHDGIDGVDRFYNPPDQKADLSLRDILACDSPATCSMLFRRDALPGLPDWYSGVAMGDWPLRVLLARNGLLGYMSSVMAVYRKHAGGAFTSRSTLQWLPGVVRTCSLLDTALGGAYHDDVMVTCLGWLNAAMREVMDEACQGLGARRASRRFREALRSGGLPRDEVRTWLGKLNAAYFVDCRDSLNRRFVIEALWEILCNDRSWFSNKGLQLTAGQTILGPQMTRGVRAIRRWMCPEHP